MSSGTAYAASVVIPAYNAGDTIGDCLESLCNQVGLDGPLQVIVVDDASTDATSEIVAGYQKRADHRRLSIRLLRQTENRGPAAARNRGAAAAQADKVLFTDSDCVPAHDWARQMLLPLSDTEVAAVKGAYETRQSALVARFAQAEFTSRYRKLARAQYIDVVFTYAAAIRKSVFEEVGGFDPSFPVADNEDTDLSWRITAAGHAIVFNPDAIVYHRHPATLVDYLGKKFRRAYWRAYVYRRFPKKAWRDSYTPQLLKIQIALVYLAIPFLVLIPFASKWLFPLMLLLGFFLVTAIPFMRSIPMRDTSLYFAAPFLLVARAAVLAFGLVAALPPLVRGSMHGKKAA